jgi:hypothetical protein
VKSSLNCSIYSQIKFILLKAIGIKLGNEILLKPLQNDNFFLLKINEFMGCGKYYFTFFPQS